MKNIHLLLLLILFSLAFTNCKKKQKRFAEDPKVTRIKPNDRLIGTWQLTDYTLNGNSVIDALNAKFNNRYNVKDIAFSYINKHSYSRDYGYSFQFKSYNRTGSGEFIDELFIRFGSGDSIGRTLFNTPLKFIGNVYTDWCVTKLYDKDLHLTLQTDTGEYKLFFNKK